MKKKTFSLKYKILLLLTLIPSLALSIYVFLAMSIFSKDKIAYIYDSSGNLSQALSQQLRVLIAGVINNNKSVFQNFVNSRSFSGVSSGHFESENGVDAILVYDVDETAKKISFVSMIARDKSEYDVFRPKLDNQVQYEAQHIQGNQRILYSLDQNDKIFFLEKTTPTAPGQKAIYFVVVIKAEEFYDTFSSSSAQQLFLINQFGQVVLGSAQVSERDITKVYDIKFLKNKANRFQQGVEETVDKNKKEMIISFADVGFGESYVLAAVKKDLALSALDQLLKKSVIFFVLLVAIIAVVSLFASGSVTNALTQLFEATQKVSQGQFDIQVQVKTSDEIGVLAENFNLMAKEVSRLLEQTAENARMQNELQTAKTVQETLFPEANAMIEKIAISGFYEPASECGGDWWHYCKINNRVFFWIGDATGHGAPSALITSAAKSAAAIIELLDVGPSAAMEYLNRCIYEVSRGRLMMTFFIACYDPITKKLTYANASHESPYLIKHKSGPVKKKDLIPLNDVNNPRLGQGRSTKYDETTVDFDSGDFIFFYTDGVPDVRSASEVAWGEREFLKAIVETQGDHPSVEVFIERFVNKMQTYRSGSTLVDDVTFFGIKNLNG
ncbi:MAG: SpoIIE family protein phosphatase [Bdellovibrionaceae bacterium]|nr:SpoIIE family protein phosphatase [Pseudobdellovibrionaceae bacterium]